MSEGSVTDNEKYKIQENVEVRKVSKSKAGSIAGAKNENQESNEIREESKNGAGSVTSRKNENREDAAAEKERGSKAKESPAGKKHKSKEDGDIKEKRLHRPTSSMFFYLVLYMGVFKFVLVPVGRFLWTQAFLHSRADFITTDNLTDIFKNPLILLAILVIALGYMVWTVLEISGIVICLDCAWHRKKIGLIALFKRSVIDTRHVLKPKNLPLLLFAAFVVPFTDIFMASDMISQIVVPEYIMEVILDQPVYLFLYAAAAAAMVVLVLECLFVFHYFILEHCDLPEAIRRSMRLVKGRRIASAVKIVFYKIWMVLKMMVFLIFTAILFLAVLLIVEPDIEIWGQAYLLILRNAYVPIFVFVMGCTITFAQYAYLTALFHRFKKADGEAETCCPPEAKPRPRFSFYKLAAVGLYVGGMALSVGLVFVLTLVIRETDFLDLLVTETKITSHRGYSAVAPENTIPSIQAAVESGVADYAEIDVQQTSDGVVVLTHDTSLKRCTGVDVDVDDITYEELAKLDASKGYSGGDAAKYAGTPVPTLDEVIKYCKGKIKLNIEIKGTTPTLVDETVRVIRENGFENECVITSLQYDALERVKELAPELKCGYIMAVGVGLYYDLPAADFFSVETTFVTPAMITELHARGKEVHAWTVDTQDSMQRMYELGVDNIITGDPVLADEVMKDRDTYFLLFEEPEQ